MINNFLVDVDIHDGDEEPAGSRRACPWAPSSTSRSLRSDRNQGRRVKPIICKITFKTNFNKFNKVNEMQKHIKYWRKDIGKKTFTKFIFLCLIFEWIRIFNTTFQGLHLFFTNCNIWKPERFKICSQELVSYSWHFYVGFKNYLSHPP